MGEGVPAAPSGAWTGRNLAVVVALLVITNAVTGVAVYFVTPRAAAPEFLVVYHPWSGSERDLFVPVLDHFTEETGIQVADRTFRQEELQTILPAQFTEQKTPADVIFMASGFIRQWGVDGHVADLTDVIDEAKYTPGVLTPVKEGATLYGAAYTMKVKAGFWYKDSLFTTKGWNKDPADFAAFQSLLATISADMVPIVSGDGVGWPLSDVVEHFIATYGGAQMHKDLVSGAKAFTDADVKAIFTTYLVPLLNAGYFDDLVEWTAGVSDLDAENNALYFQGSWLPTMSQTSDESDMRAMPLPGGVANQGIIGPVDYVFIPKYTTRMADAQSLLEFLISKEGQEEQIEQGGHFATHVDADPTKAPPTYSGDLIAGKELLPDLDDTVGGAFQTTFWAQLQLLWSDPSQLDAVLTAIEAAR